ncbi:MAG: hypothetical protein U1E15_14195 [Hyphomicrobiales bacterium]
MAARLRPTIHLRDDPSSLAAKFPAADLALEEGMAALEKHYRDAVEVEFTPTMGSSGFCRPGPASAPRRRPCKSSRISCGAA